MGYTSLSTTYNRAMDVSAAVIGAKNYSTLINPSYGTGSYVDISASFVLFKLLGLGTNGEIRVLAMLYFMWSDLRLQWDTSFYSNLSSIDINPSSVWTPSICLLNSLDENMMLDLKNGSTASLRSSGLVVLGISRKFSAKCTLDLSRFPYDSQNCTFEFLGLDASENLNNLAFSVASESSIVTMAMYSGDGELTLDGVHYDAGKRIVGVGSAATIIASFNVTLSFTRNPSYYISSVAVPSMLLLLSSALVFCLPSDNSVKITMSCSLTVALYVLQQAVSRMLPATKTTPLLATGMMMQLALGCFSLVCAVLTVALRGLQPPLGRTGLKLVSLCERYFVHPADRTAPNRVEPLRTKQIVVTKSKVTSDFDTDADADADADAVGHTHTKETATFRNGKAAELKSRLAELDQANYSTESEEQLTSAVMSLVRAIEYDRKDRRDQLGHDYGKLQTMKTDVNERARQWKVMDACLNTSFLLVYLVCYSLCGVYIFGVF